MAVTVPTLLCVSSRVAAPSSFADAFGPRRRPLGDALARFDFYDLSLGGRVALWRATVIGSLNVIVPLNRDGLRADVIPLAGIEATL